jgi:ubiquinone/menaquinone biosynthesis C-methylase UbiE
VRGSVEFRRGRWRLSASQNVGTLISQEIILTELQEFLERHFSKDRTGSVLDLGAGSKPYEPLYATYFESATAVDVPHSLHGTDAIDVFASADDLPFGSESFDCVICTEVLEHCREPRAVMAEIARVLNHGGRAFITTPFLLPLHDELPFDFYRFTPWALEDLATGAGLGVESIAPRGSYLAVALRVIQMPIAKIWQRLASRTALPLYNAYNPFIWSTVVLPEELYLLLWRYVRRRPSGRLARSYEKLTYYTLGYVTALVKPVASQ